ncbi:MAG: exosortase-associated EpsI family protein [Thermoguttaceae bacterium]
MNNKQVWFVLSLAVVMALTLASGVIEGRIRNRWGPSETMLAAAEKLEKVPRQFGGPQNDRWQLQSSETMDQDTVEMLECTGYILRTYGNPRTGEMVSTFVVVGPAGPIAVHTPEICFPSQNYKSRDTRQQVAIPDDQGQEDRFWALSFKSKNIQEDLIRVYYAWSTGNRWSAADDARFAFVGSPYLYKIQLSSTLPAGADPKTDDTCKKFLKDFVPVVRQYLTVPSR